MLVKISTKSGSDAEKRTERQPWILESFEFISVYLVHVRQQGGSKVNNSIVLA